MPERDTTRTRHVVVVLGHPRGMDSLCGALALDYHRAAKAAGAVVDLIDLSRADFDPNVQVARPQDQTLEPDLAALRAAVDGADHVAFVYPTWWGTMPALMKGALDRLLVPGWAFRTTTGGTGYEPMLRGRTAELITTMDTPGPVYRFIYGAPGHRAMARATLGFCGFRMTRFTRFGPVRDSAAPERQRWIAASARLGRDGGAGNTRPVRATWTSVAPWLQALRLQFYPMTFLAYWMGALAAVPEHVLRDPLAFWLGYALLFLLEAATVFTNDVFDAESDRRNAHYGPFTGGSRVVQSGVLTPRKLLLGAAVALVLAAALLAVLAIRSDRAAFTVGFFLTFAVIALGYTLPPLKFSHRGLGELVVAITHSFGAIYAGLLLQTGDLGDSLPLQLSVPLAIAVLAAIALSGVPDVAADRAAGKRTLTVIFGPRAIRWIAVACVAVSAALASWLWARGEPAWAGAVYVVPVHAVLLIWLLLRWRPPANTPARIDGLMMASLGYIIWFAAIPLANLA